MGCVEDIAHLVVCWTPCPASGGVLGSILLKTDLFPVEGIFPLGVNTGSDSIPLHFFG